MVIFIIQFSVILLFCLIFFEHDFINCPVIYFINSQTIFGIRCYRCLFPEISGKFTKYLQLSRHVVILNYALCDILDHHLQSHSVQCRVRHRRGTYCVCLFWLSFMGLYPDTGDQCSQLIVATLVPSTPIVCLFFNLAKLQCKQTVVTDFCIGFVNKIHIIGKGTIKVHEDKHRLNDRTG